MKVVVTILTIIHTISRLLLDLALSPLQGIKGSRLCHASRILQIASTAPRLRILALPFPTHHNRLDPLPVALPTGEAGRSSARQPEAPGPGRGL
jgi:hypothetical protein